MNERVKAWKQQPASNAVAKRAVRTVRIGLEKNKKMV